MNTLIVTLEDYKDLDTYITLGVQQVIVAVENHTFSALHEMNLQQMKQVISFAHSKHVEVIALMNRIYSEQEIHEAQTTMFTILDSGMDYVMFADPGLLKYAKDRGRESKLIYRPETLMTSSYDTEFWMKQGLHSVVIPSLITKQEITEIASFVKHTTVIVHGSTLMSVSKRRLLASFQEATNTTFDVTSKHLTLKEKQREGHMPIYENAYATMIYTDYIQESFQEMQDFIQAGVQYFEIDTPFMPKEMIVDTIQIYRMILDGKDASKNIQTYLETYHDLSDGYYGQKTVK